MANAATTRVSPCAVPAAPPLKAFLLRDLGGIDRALKSHYPLRPNFLASDHPLIDFGWDALSLTLSFESSLSSPSYPVRDDVEGRNEELVADEGEGVEHVEDADGVQHDGAVLPLLLREQVRREEGVVPAAVSLGGKLDAAEKEERE